MILKRRIRKLSEAVVRAYNQESEGNPNSDYNSVLQHVVFNRYRLQLKNLNAEEAVLKVVNSGSDLLTVIVNMCIWEDCWPDYDFGIMNEGLSFDESVHKNLHAHDEYEILILDVIKKEGLAYLIEDEE